MPVTELENLNLARIHLVGISGAGMNALSDVLLDLGCTISGSDLKLSDTTSQLVSRGARIFEGHRAENLGRATLVVKTAAAPDDNLELAAARAAGIPIISLAQMVGALVNARRGLAIAGTHGKTTTTAFVTYLLDQAGIDPTFFIGGVSQNLGVAGRAGKSEWAVVEADEYARRFLEYRPELALVLNIEPDHLDYYGSFEAIIEAFEQYAWNVRPGGILLAPLPGPEDLGLQEFGANLLEKGYLEERNFETFTLLEGAGEEPEGAATFEGVLQGMGPNGGFQFDLFENGQFLARAALSIPGRHNVHNAVAALALCRLALPELDIKKLAEIAGTFKGTKRRFEIKGEAAGVTVVDDYAHFPTEIKATLAGAVDRFPGRRLIALFQPHTFSRTKEHLEEFAGSFTRAGRVAIMEIFAAREANNLGISSQDLLNRITQPEKLPEVLTQQSASVKLLEILKPGDVLLTLGAGDVWKVGEEILAGLTKNE